MGKGDADIGFKFGELKPYTMSGIDGFLWQLELWETIDPVKGGVTPGNTRLFFYGPGGIIGSSDFNF